MLLTGELPEFCCNRGKRMIPSLPPYPKNINNILIDPTSIGVQGQFVTLPAPSSVCITGHTYHHRKIPNEWILAVQSMLDQNNPYVNSLKLFQQNFLCNAVLELRKNTSTGEVAAIMHADSIVNIHPHFENENDKDEKGDLYLPASFLGSKRCCLSYIAYALALAHCREKPSFFITMTTNLNWSEIRSQLQLRQNALEIALIVVHSFHSHLKKLKELLCVHLEKIIYIDDKSRLRELVKKYMIHNKQYLSRCLRNNKCIYQYSKPIIPETSINEKGFVQYCHHTQEDLWIVLYNPILISKLECHINFEVASTVHLLMYLYKYLFKGPDYVKFTINNTPNTIPEHLHKHNTKIANIDHTISQHINEFEDYINGRVVLVAPGAGELFYLRSILLHHAARTWNDLKKINRNIYNTYQEAAREMGLFANESESTLAMKRQLTIIIHQLN
ncbi:32781_t:CDS:2 [Gigaspora margarita]|uniref:32781_t:CDS:1 n=1 Tax=Gigaspora margarita TaxID=4874 RepID=A0ABM8W5Z9_GIGMA|nr:32781_t:CDS:2 [Gigaspora margarita]